MLQPTNILKQRIKVQGHKVNLSLSIARRSEHMTPVLRDLHWLSVRQRITFKLLVYKCLHGMAQQYLHMHYEPTSTVTSRRLRSAHSRRLTVPRTRTNYGDRSFAVQGPRCGTVFLLNFVHQTLRWRRSETDLRHSCSICNCYPAHLQLFPILRYINVLNNSNNMTQKNQVWFACCL